jgi:hypothetical protein
LSRLPRIAAIALGAVLGVLASWVPGARACGPEFPYAVFSHARHPDLPYERYAAGDLGLVRPTFARAYLVLAYRAMTLGPPDPVAQGVALSAWDFRSGAGGWSGGFEDRRRREQLLSDWLAERSRVPGVTVATTAEAYGRALGRGRAHPWGETLLLPAPSLELAIATLRARRAEPGMTDARVRAWVARQDSVFSARGIVSPDSPGSVAEDAHDAAYQSAAAAFGAADYARAEREFSALAANAGSPRGGLAAYLAARSVERAAQRTDPDDDWSVRVDVPLMRRAEDMLDAILADATLRDVHGAAASLRGFVRFRAHPAERLGELAASVLAPVPAPEARQDWIDLLILLDRVADGDSVFGQRGAVLEAARRSDLVDWVMTFQRAASARGRAGEPADGDPWSGDPYAHARARWRATRSPAWLVCALVAAGPSSPGVDDAMAAAAALPAGSPARVTAATHLARLLAMRGEAGAARSLCERELAASPPLSAANALRGLRASLATDLDDLLAWGVRAPARITTGADDGTGGDSLAAVADTLGPDAWRRPFLLQRRAECFDDDLAACFNRRLPLADWRRALESPALPRRLRRELAAAGWTRAVLAGRDGEAVVFAGAVDSLAPECRDDLATWRAATGDAREFAAALLVARMPGLQPYLRAGVGRLDRLDRLDDYRDNWWCGREGPPDWFAAPDAATGPRTATWRAPEGADLAGLDGPGGFVPAAERAAAVADTLALAAVPGAPAWLGARILAFARAHPDDPRVPEALHRVVRAQRLGCGGDAAREQAREAFQLLHRRYPASAWTKRTRVWG